jgi:biotin carboxylase
MVNYLLVLGGNAFACPAIEHLNRVGFKTLVLDANPSSPARECATRFVRADFSKFNETKNAVSTFNLAGIMPLNDFGVRTASKLSLSRGLPGYTELAARNVTNKLYMKQSWIKAGLPTPRFTWANRYDIRNECNIEWTDFPCIMKPAYAGGGSRGVYLVNNHEEIRQYLMESWSVYRDDEVIIEEYIDGSEHTIEVIVFKGQAYLLSISDKVNYPENVSVVQNLYFPGKIGHQNKEDINDLISSACHALGLSNGSAHFEILIRNKDIYLLEVGGRPGGGLNFYPICILSSGYDYPLELARVLTGKSPYLENHKETVCLGWHFFTIEQGVLKEIAGFEKVKKHPKVIDAQLFIKIGQRWMGLSDDLNRPGYLLVSGKDHEEVDNLLEELKNMIYFKVE